MGLRALYNGVIRFDKVYVGREDIIDEEGRGLRVALTTLNTGRITLPAAAAGLARRCLEISSTWAASRVQWGQSIGKHAAIADKLARMEAHRFAIESMVYYISALVDGDKKADIRIEAALAKLWGTEKGWQAIDDTMQIRGGRGYETVASLRERGESPDPVERFFRDARINTIFEGSSEIMRLFVAREAMDPHLGLGARGIKYHPPDERAGCLSHPGRAFLQSLVSCAVAADAGGGSSSREDRSWHAERVVRSEPDGAQAGKVALPRHGS